MVFRINVFAIACACAPALLCANAYAQERAFTPAIAFKTAVGASDALEDETAAELDFDVGFNWRPSRNTTVVVNIETRDRMTDTRFADIVGAADLLTGVADGTTGGPLTRLEKFWVRQDFAGGDASVTLGRLHFEDHFLDNALSSKSATAFANEIFSGKPGVALPRDAMGAVGSFRLTDALRATFIVGDAHRERELDLFASGEVFAASELNAAIDPFGLGQGHYRAGVWSRNVEESADFGEIWGVGVSVDQPIGDGETLMFRYFHNEGGARPAEDGAAVAVSADAGFVGRSHDQIGAGVGWLCPIAPGHESQWTGEVFYRWQVTDMVAITPNVQVVTNDGDASVRDQSVYGGVRLRLKYPS